MGAGVGIYYRALEAIGEKQLTGAAYRRGGCIVIRTKVTVLSLIRTVYCV